MFCSCIMVMMMIIRFDFFQTSYSTTIELKKIVWLSCHLWPITAYNDDYWTILINVSILFHSIHIYSNLKRKWVSEWMRPPWKTLFNHHHSHHLYCWMTGLQWKNNYQLDTHTHTDTHRLFDRKKTIRKKFDWIVNRLVYTGLYWVVN